MKRAICLVLLLLAPLIASCGPNVTPTAVVPTATVTPLPVAPSAPAHETASAYLDAWASRDYAAMHALCSAASRTSTPLDEFVATYERVAQRSTLVAVRPTLKAVLQEGTRARAAFTVEFDTSFVGSFSDENELPLVWEGQRWAVDWSRVVILRALEGDNTLNMQSRVPVRANIYDVQGKGLAVKGDLVTVGVVPGEIEDEPALLSRLAVVLHMPQTEIRAEYEGQPSNWFIPIADITVDESRQHYDFLSKAAGITLRPKSVRVYTTPVVAPHVVGYLSGIPAEEVDAWRAQGYSGDELVGRTGIEAWGEPYLAGQRGGVLTVITPEGQVVTTLAHREAIPARSVYLTFEHAFQQTVEELLGERRGSVVVLDVHTGRVLALATWPRFDLNVFAEGIDPLAWSTLANDPARPLLNRPIQGQYAPGSSFKIVTMGTIMERGGVPPTKTYSCPGVWSKLGWPMTCWLKSGHGTIDLVTALTASCDVTFYQVGYDLSFIDMDALPSSRVWPGRTDGAGPGPGRRLGSPGRGQRPRARRRVEAPGLWRWLVDRRYGQPGHRPGLPAGHPAADGAHGRCRGQRGHALPAAGREQGRCCGQPARDPLPAGARRTPADHRSYAPGDPHRARGRHHQPARHRPAPLCRLSIRCRWQDRHCPERGRAAARLVRRLPACRGPRDRDRGHGRELGRGIDLCRAPLSPDPARARVRLEWR
jgi:penicillin-binding protein 2